LLSDAEVAALYDVQNPWELGGHPENAYVSALVATVDSVLDVGCGTGSMLHVARREGHVGRLVGIDPDPAMLARARRRDDIEWVLGKADGMPWVGEFDLATMNSNAFQCLVTDDELGASLQAIRTALRDGGRFAFGTRHVQARAWESWNPSNAFDTTLPDGQVLRMWHQVESVVDDVVTMTETTGRRADARKVPDRGRLAGRSAVRRLAARTGHPGEPGVGDDRTAGVSQTSRSSIVSGHLPDRISSCSLLLAWSSSGRWSCRSGRGGVCRRPVGLGRSTGRPWCRTCSSWSLQTPVSVAQPVSTPLSSLRRSRPARSGPRVISVFEWRSTGSGLESYYCE
jgi:SAM-dependent methyltransferase